MIVLNLTQHVATPDQYRQGVVEPDAKQEVVRLLTFDELPTEEEVVQRAETLADLASRELTRIGVAEGDGATMIGGAPFLMAPLERALHALRIKPVYSFSLRESIDHTLPDGSVRKVANFRHIDFVPAVAVEAEDLAVRSRRGCSV